MNKILSDYDSAISKLQSEIDLKTAELARLMKERDLELIKDAAAQEFEKLTDKEKAAKLAAIVSPVTTTLPTLRK